MANEESCRPLLRPAVLVGKASSQSDAGIREIPLAPLVVEAIRRQLPPEADGNALVFAGPGGGNGACTRPRPSGPEPNWHMGHQRSRHGELEGGSRIGTRYRHTTPEMADRVVHVLDRRLTLTLQVAEAITPAELGRSDRVF